MKKIMIGIFLISVVLLLGCSSNEEETNTVAPEEEAMADSIDVEYVESSDTYSSPCDFIQSDDLRKYCTGDCSFIASDDLRNMC